MSGHVFMSLKLPTGEPYLEASLVPDQHGFWLYAINGVLRRDEFEHAHTAEHVAFTELRGILLAGFAHVRRFSRSDFARVNLERDDNAHGRTVQGKNYRITYTARSGRQFVGHTSKARALLYVKAAESLGFKVKHSRPVIVEPYGRRRHAVQYRVLQGLAERSHIITLDCRAPRHSRPVSERSRMMAQAGPLPIQQPALPIEFTATPDIYSDSIWTSPEYAHVHEQMAIEDAERRAAEQDDTK